MSPEVLWYAEPYEGLKVQLTELRGLIKLVPPLIEADRERRWKEIGARPGDPDSDMIDIYENEAGPEEGWGHAAYDRVLYSTAVISAWETFHVYIVRQLFDASLKFKLEKYPALAKLVEDERRTWDRQFYRVKQRYEDFLGVKLTSLSGWDSIAHAQELRNALVHNLGLYTTKYLGVKRARRPDPEDFHGHLLSTSDDRLVNHKLIPLTKDFSDEVICHLIEVAKEIDDAVKGRQSAV